MKLEDTKHSMKLDENNILEGQINVFDLLDTNDLSAEEVNEIKKEALSLRRKIIGNRK